MKNKWVPCAEFSSKCIHNNILKLLKNINIPNWLCLYFSVALSTIQFLHTTRMSMPFALIVWWMNCERIECGTGNIMKCVWWVKCQWRFVIALFALVLFLFLFLFSRCLRSYSFFIICVYNCRYVSICEIDESRIDLAHIMASVIVLIYYFATLSIYYSIRWSITEIVRIWLIVISYQQIDELFWWGVFQSINAINIAQFFPILCWLIQLIWCKYESFFFLSWVLKWVSQFSILFDLILHL